MCGISGWVGPKDSTSAERMRAALRHRGPDDRGEYEDDQATLLHERLSIIDLKCGHQPIANEDGSLHIVFNGEIYNYLELRRDLSARGHRFRTASDTEVILHLYEEMGERCPEKLIGMFAFAIWDSSSRTLFLARDRLGIKPLFYAQADERLLFASELKAILAHGAIRRELDPVALDQYMTFMYVPAPGTIVKGVSKLLPGHTLTWRDGKLATRSYWQIPPVDAASAALPYDQAVERLRALLQEAVRCRLMSEVPLGAYLSGGLDSSLVAALMARASERPVNTFSVGFEEPGFDERRWAAAAAREIGANHRELVVRRHSVEELPRIIRYLDEPVADPAAIPTYFMAEITKPHVTVVLTGEGADELFAGYSHYKILCWADRLAAYSPGAAARWLASVLPGGAAARLAEYAGQLRNRPRAYLALKAVFTEAEKDRLYSPGLRESLRGVRAPLETAEAHLGGKSGPYLNRLLRFDLATWLPDDLLVKADRMTMAHAVEARVPYLDHRVVEEVMLMPPDWKLRGLSGKRILRSTASGIIPPAIVHRRKTGFAVPVGQWAAAEMRDLVRELLGPNSVHRRGLFEPQPIAELLNRRCYSMFERRQLWTLICLEVWCREFMDVPQAS